MRLFLKLLKDYPRRSVLVLVCIALSVAADGIGISTWLPLLSVMSGDGGGSEPKNAFAQRVTETIESLGLSPTIGVLLLILVVAAVLKGVLNLFAKRQVGYAVAQVATDLRLELLDALTVTRWSFYTRQPIGTLTAAFSSEADRGSKAYLYATNMIGQLLQALLFVSIAAAVSWHVTLVAATVGGIATVSLSSLVRMTRRAGLKQTRVMRRAIARLTDSLQALKPLRAMAREERIGPLLASDTNRLNNALRKLVLSKEALRAIQEPILVSFLAAGLYVAVAVRGMQISEILVLAALFARTFNAVNRMQREYQNMVSQEPAYWSIRETLTDANDQSETRLGHRSPTLDHGIVLRDLDFRYGDKPVLQNVTIEIPAGRITGLIGHSGGGKTTVTDLIVGLVRPDAGEVYVDDVPLEQIDLHAWRHSIGYVPQEMFLLHDTVYQNITLGDPKITPEQVERALERAGASDFVAQMPDGVMSSVGERGSLLSGGQRQRISIARALVHDPKLLLMDEATAALDPDTEQALWRSLVKLKGEITIVAISHQPALFEAADVIYRLQNGEARRLAEGEKPAALALA